MECYIKKQKHLDEKGKIHYRLLHNVVK